MTEIVDWRKLNMTMLHSPSSSDNERSMVTEIPIELLSKLNPKQRDFLDILVTSANMNVAEASRKAGYSESNAWKIYRKPESKAYVNALRWQRSSATVMSYNEILEQLTSIARADESSFDDYVNAKTGQVHKVRPNAQSRINALEKLAKYQKILSDGNPMLTVNTGTQTIVVDIDDDMKEVLANEGKFNLESDREVDRKDITDDSTIIDVNIED
ncbi:hypothetical protein IKS_03674 [Bacillus cereus VDM062]|nr:hypothetical protein IKS_03674 [Bacillus cereus VDM062]